MESFPFLEDGRPSIDLGADPWDVVLLRGLPLLLLWGNGGDSVWGVLLGEALGSSAPAYLSMVSSGNWHGKYGYRPLVRRSCVIER